MAINLSLVAGQVPEGTCPTTWQQVVQIIRDNLQVQIPESLGFGLFTFSSATPSSDRQGFPWFKTNADGSPDDIYAYSAGAWVGFGFSRPPSQSVFDARLTLSSGVPLPTSDVTGSTLYLTPYDGNVLALYNGTRWVHYGLTAEVSLSIGSLSASTVYDVFVYYDGSTFILETVAWSGATARATALASQNGVYVQAGAANKRYVGTLRITATPGQCADTLTQRFLWNYYHRTSRELYRELASSGGATWTYATSTFRLANGSASSLVEAVFGLAAQPRVKYVVRVNGSAVIGVGVDSVTPASGAAGYSTASTYDQEAGTTRSVAEGYHAFNAVEYAVSSTNFGAVGVVPNGAFLLGAVQA